MKISSTALRKVLFLAVLFFIVVFILLGTDLYIMWIPFLAHGVEYAAKVSVLFVAASVLVTSVLAYIAALSIEENKELRRESRSREENDRKERLLNEIIDWAKDIHNNLFGSIKMLDRLPRLEERIAGKGYIDLHLQDVLRMDSVEQDVSTLDTIGILIRDGNFIEVIASGINSEMASLIHVAIEQMEHRRALIFDNSKFKEIDLPSADKILGGEINKWARLNELRKDKSASLNGLSEEDQISVKMTRNTSDIKESADKIVKKAIELKLSL